MKRLPGKKQHPEKKSRLHPRSKHRGRYDFVQLIDSCPELAPFVSLNKFQDESINFFDPKAVRVLNRALLKHHYGINFWDIPPGYLCPPIPGRADYIHHIADLLYAKRPDFLRNKIKLNSKVKCLDIGTGASCIYPIIGHKTYGWLFTATDIDRLALESATSIANQNPALNGKIEFRLQENPKDIFRGIIQDGAYYDLSICNPPFHASASEAEAGTKRKLRNLTGKKALNPGLNFGGQSHELWCEGGELRFVETMIQQSKSYATSCLWFSTLVSKEVHLQNAYRVLKEVEALEVQTIPMGQGNKVSRILAWTFLTSKQQQVWQDTRW